MPNFSMLISGEATPRSFRYDTKKSTLYTDAESEDPKGGMIVQSEVAISESTITLPGQNPLLIRYWQETLPYRNAYHLCETENISLEAALAYTQQNASVASDVAPIADSGTSVFNGHATQDTPIASEGELSASAGAVLITNQQLLLELAFELLDQYVDTDDKNYQLLAFLKSKAVKLYEQKIIIDT